MLLLESTFVFRVELMNELPAETMALAPPLSPTAALQLMFVNKANT